jgi:hypothetical protein
MAQAHTSPRLGVIGSRDLGVETQRQWNEAAIERSTPVLLYLFSLVTLMVEPIIANSWRWCATICGAKRVLACLLARAEVQKREQVLLERMIATLCYKDELPCFCPFWTQQ